MTYSIVENNMSHHRTCSYKHKQDVCLNRRRFLTMGVGLAATLLARPSLASLHKQDDRSLSFHNLHTGEKLEATFWENGRYLNDAMSAINHVLRDHRTNDVHPMDPKLLELLHTLSDKVGVQKPFQIISGYRSPATNNMLSKASSRVAKKSYHMQGRAIDVFLPGCELSDLHKAALSMKQGGVGYYPRSNFIHVDTGKVRSW